MDIEITQDIIDYIINNRSRFEMDIPKLGEKWNVESITTYSGVNCGNPVVELSNDNKDWMVLPKELLYQQLEDMLDESLSKETTESWNKRLESTCVSEDLELEEAAKHYLYSNILYDDVYVGNPTDKDCIEMFKAGAKWQKEQIMKDAINTVVHIDAGNYPYIPQIELYDYDNDIPLAKGGEKVKVIVIRED